MKKYSCHKEVEAFKIESMFEDINFNFILRGYDGEISVSKEWVEKHNPQIGGYFVQYADGYTSYSPAKAFEEGYKEII